MVKLEKTLQGSRGGCGLLQDMHWHIHQRRATFGEECRCEFCPSSISEIERAALRIENPGRAFDNQTVEVARADRVAESFTEAMKKIEDQRFFDLDLLL